MCLENENVDDEVGRELRQKSHISPPIPATISYMIVASFSSLIAHS